MKTPKPFKCKACKGEKEPQIHAAKGLCLKCYRNLQSQKSFHRMIASETKAERKARLERKAFLMRRYRSRAKRRKVSD